MKEIHGLLESAKTFIYCSDRTFMPHELLILSIRNGKKIHYFTPFSDLAGKSPTMKKKYSEIYLSWEASYNKAPALIKSLTDKLIERIENDFSEVRHEPAHTRSWYYFSLKGVKSSKKAKFLVFWLTQTHLHLRIGIDPSSFKDPNHITKTYKGWFWSRLPNIQERGFDIASEKELDYALTLVKQSYERSKKG